ncbi:Sodium/hydrogen exchanger 9B2 [Boothiomyces sp. JEL0838]|nr:Sodium/hydrogen exchanger 9B2 [Boothiomyces sp. JEL0838]
MESLLLGTLPILTEASVLAYVSKSAFNLPTSWAFTLAFGVATISPGVVVPLLLKLMDNGWQKSRLPPMMLAGVGMDVLLGTSGFGISLASCFGHSHEGVEQESWVIRGIEEIGMGFLLGIILGFTAFAYSRLRISENISTPLVFICSCLTMFWCKTHGFTGAASCSTFLTWSAVGNSWIKTDVESADEKLKNLWKLFKYGLFPVIGATISFDKFSFTLLVRSLLIILFSVMVKMGAAYLTAQLADLSEEEAFFIAGIWTGKASIQATLCGVALEKVHEHHLHGKPEQQYAQIVFLCLVCSIIIGVPFASIWVGIFGKDQIGPDLVDTIQEVNKEEG